MNGHPLPLAASAASAPVVPADVPMATVARTVA